MVINTMGWIDGLGYELILHALGALRVDVILVIGQDRFIQPAQQPAQGKAAWTHAFWCS